MFKPEPPDQIKSKLIIDLDCAKEDMELAMTWGDGLAVVQREWFLERYPEVRPRRGKDTR